MMVNRITNITFKENTLSREMNSQNAILMLRDPNASVKFEHNQEIAQNADASSSNPITAIGYKLYKTFSLIKESNSTKTQGVNQGVNQGVTQGNRLNTIA